MAYNPNKAVEGIVDYKHKYDHAKATGKDTSEFEKGAAAYYKELRDNGRSDVADYLQKSDSITAGEYLKTLTPNYQATAGDLQAKSNDVYDWTKDAGSQIAKDYDMVFQTIGVTPTRTDYGKDILGGYGLAAEGAYKGTLGGASVDNGGNVDSYAAAQANRNKAAMVKEGYGTVLDYYNSIAGNATKWAGDKANALGGFAGLMQGNVTDDRDVVKTAFNGTVDLEKTRMQTDAEKYGHDKNLEGITDTNKVDTYLGELDYSKGVYNTQLGAASSTAKDALGNQTFFGMNNVPAPAIYTKDADGNMVTIVPGANTTTSETTVAGADGATATGDYKDLPDNGGHRSAVTPIVENKQYDNMYASGTGDNYGNNSGNNTGNDSGNNSDNDSGNDSGNGNGGVIVNNAFDEKKANPLWDMVNGMYLNTKEVEEKYGVKPEPLKSETEVDKNRSKYIGEQMAKYKTNEEKKRFLNTISNRFGLSDGNILWLMAKYGIEL